MTETKQIPPNDDTHLENLLKEAAFLREVPIPGHTFLRSWTSYSYPVALACDDGNEYVVKGQHAKRGIVNDQIVARLGLALNAPVGRPAIIFIPPDLISNEPQLHGVTGGTAHGTIWIKNCSDRLWLEHTDVTENRRRFALLSVLYGWCHAGDHQLIYENVEPNLVHSVDHGHFFPGGPDWTINTLESLQDVSIYEPIVNGCSLTPDEIRIALESLSLVEDSAIIGAVAMPPDEWGLTGIERSMLVRFLIERRNKLLASLR